MEGLLNFAMGPLFRLTFAVMLLGLLRIFALDIIQAWEAYRRAGDKKLPWGQLTKDTVTWLVPINKVFRNRPIYSIFSVLFHIGLLLVPIFLYAHVQLWQGYLPIPWLTLSYETAYWLTLLTIVTAFALLIGRITSSASSHISRKQDYLWPVLLLVPFVTGFFCAHLGLGPKVYQISMLFHVLSAELIFFLIPFTKIAHCVLMPLSQYVVAIAWKFPPETDEKIAVTLEKKGEPV